MTVPVVHTANQIRKWDCDVQTRDGQWIPARPLGHSMFGPLWRWKLAWRVLTGRYDALDWEEHR